MGDRPSVKEPLGFPNVRYDEHSEYRWEQLNETAFLAEVFARLATHLGDAFHRHEFHIFSSDGRPDLPASAGRSSQLTRSLVFISDESAEVPTRLLGSFDFIFKAYLPHSPGERSRIHPFPLGPVDGVPELVGPSADARATRILFSGRLNRPRAALYAALHPTFERMPLRLAARSVELRIHARVPMRREFIDTAAGEHIVFTDGFKAGMGPDEYAAHLADAAVVLCPRGARQPETFRHYEALRAGAVVVSERLPDHGLHVASPIVQVADWRQGLAEARRIVRDRELLLSLQEASIRYFRDVLSPDATARRMAQVLRG